MKLLSIAPLGLVVDLVVIVTAITDEEFIGGPVPAIIVAPLADTVKFTCKVNTTLIAVAGVIWRVGSQVLFTEDVEIPSPGMTTSTLSIEVIASYKSGVLIKCGVLLQSGSPSRVFSTSNASLTAYGTVLVYYS